jgi:diaminohydroxyphosphoribosylaminopyrimidine deaminase/5-amino-6-(5-phosphoribosylamino)uracil reductase
MRLALEQARGVRGHTSPNPWVGAVVVRDGSVVCAGATAPPGGPHAEAAALSGVEAAGCDLYVTLEPCVAFPGKRTPPCVERIIEAGVRRVVVAMLDPDPNVGGRGVAILRDAGVVVEVGDGAEEARALLRPYLKHRRTGLPYVIAKFAASLDGRIATVTGESKWITGPEARDLGHQQRAWVDAVMVGSGTILADDPELTARPGGLVATRQPVRIVLDGRGRVPAGARVFATPGAIVATTVPAPGGWKRELAAAGVQVIECEAAREGVNLDQLLTTLGQRGIVSIWAEGGGTLLGALFGAGHVDELWAFIAPMVIGGDGLSAVGPFGIRAMADAWRLQHSSFEEVGGDILIRGVFPGPWDAEVR